MVHEFLLTARLAIIINVYIYIHIVHIYICNIIMCHINILFYMTTILGHLTNTHMYMYIQTHKQHSVYMCIYIYICFYFILHAGCFLKIQCIMLKSNIQTARHVMYVFMYKHIYMYIYI